jgi:hypothetical protein
LIESTEDAMLLLHAMASINTLICKEDARLVKQVLLLIESTEDAMLHVMVTTNILINSTTAKLAQ